MTCDAVKFKRAAEGFGFELMEQDVDGVYCDGCMTIHKRPTQMYADRPIGQEGRTIMCKYAVIRFYYNAEDWK